MRRDRQTDGIGHLLFRMAEQFGRHDGSRDDAVGRLIPNTTTPLRSGIDESAKDFITQYRSEDYVFAVAVSCVHHGQHRGKEVARVAGR